jgi:hypothetical protein
LISIDFQFTCNLRQARAWSAAPRCAAKDPFLDLVAAEEQRMQEEGLERRIRRRYAVWGDVSR